MATIKRLFFLLLIPVFLFLTACGDGLTSEKLGGVRGAAGDLYPERVAMIGGEDVSFDEFRYYYLNFRDQYEAEGRAPGNKEEEEALKEDVLDTLKIKYAALLLAEEKGVVLTAEEEAAARQEIADALKFYGSEGLSESLHASYMSRQMFREMTRYSVLYDKLFQTLYGEGGSEAWDDETFLNYYGERYLAAQEIFFPYEKGEKAGDAPLTLAKAEEALAALAEGADFWTLVEEMGQDPAMELEPDGYYFTEGEAEEVLYEATKALAEGEVSRPVEGAIGVYLIRRMPLLTEKVLKRKADVLSGYTDGAGTTHAGAYDEAFRAMLEEKARTLSVARDPVWDKIDTKSVF